MTQRTFMAVSAALILAQLPAFAKPKRKEFDNPAAQVFDAAIKTARSHHVVTYVEQKRLIFTFETGRSSLTSGFIANASVEAEGETKSALVINVQHKEAGDGFSFNAGDRMTDKFYDLVALELARNPLEKMAVKPETPPAKVPPPPAATPDYGTLAVTCSIESADLTVDGSFVGNLPASLRLSSGRHTVQVNLTGYKPWSREITVMAGAELRLIVTLTKE